MNVRGRFPGRNHIVFTKPASTFVDIVGTVTVLYDAKVFFHFVDGPPGIKTSRLPGVETAFIQTMNRIYRGQTGIVFASAGTNPSLKVPGVIPRRGGVPVFQNGTTDEHKAIVSNRKPDSLFNVFFVGDLADMSLSGAPADFLGLTSFSDHSSLIRRIASKLTGVPGRCCLLRDPQPRDPAGIDFGVVIAHEAGHALDQDEADDADLLMFDSASKQTGTKIPFIPTAIDMLDSAVRFPP